MARPSKPLHCAHIRIAGEWLSAAHVARCLGVPRGDLVQACYDGKVTWRVVGRGHKRSLQVLAEDVKARWPREMALLA